MKRTVDSVINHLEDISGYKLHHFLLNDRIEIHENSSKFKEQVAFHTYVFEFLEFLAAF